MRVSGYEERGRLTWAMHSRPTRDVAALNSHGSLSILKRCLGYLDFSTIARPGKADTLMLV